MGQIAFYALVIKIKCYVSPVRQDPLTMSFGTVLQIMVSTVSACFVTSD